MFMIHSPLDPIIQKFKFFMINKIDQIEEIKEIKNESKTIVIDQVGKPYNEYLVTIFDYIIIACTKSNINFLSKIFNNNTESTIYTQSDEIYTALSSELQSKLYKYESPFEADYLKTIEEFSKNFQFFSSKEKEIQDIWNSINPILSAYLINKSYKISQEKRYSAFNKKQQFDLTENEFIELQTLGESCTSKVYLIYHLEKEELFALKKFTDPKEKKLFIRELENLNKIHHPNVPIFYGATTIDKIECIILEYIRGVNLCEHKNIKCMKLTEQEQYSIILQVMLTIEYLQSKKFIYRDLKPNNLILNENKEIILIDFDRMIGKNEQKNISESTQLFNNRYMAPEIYSEKFVKYSNKEDIYSIGLLIYYIITLQFPTKERIDKSNNVNYSFSDLPPNYKKLIKICEECCETDPNKRTKITKLIDYFYNKFIMKNLRHRMIDIDNDNDINNMIFYPEWNYDNICLNFQFMKKYNKKIVEIFFSEIHKIHLLCQCLLVLENFPIGCYSEDYFYENISSFISCLNSISNENQAESQFILGFIYYKGQYVPRDINKSIHYLTLSADQDNSYAQCQIGIIYLEGTYVKQDINKSIHYLTLSADQDNSYAQYQIGKLYLEGTYVKQDINKSIHYLTLSADQNNSYGQCLIGILYLEGKYVKQDIAKSIYYLTLSADQNNPIAQCRIGILYLNEIYDQQDISKSIHYLMLSADQKNPIAQCQIGIIYHEGIYVQRDINKSIHYLKLSADQKNSDALFELGLIYYLGKYVPKDIDRCVYYWTQSTNGNSVAQCFLGMYYFLRKKDSEDFNKSYHFFKLSANQKNKLAQYHLGLIYYFGEYLTKDINKAIYYFKLSADQNYEMAQYYLGIIYYNGENGNIDIKKSIYYLELSANQNCINALNLLGLIYYDGFYVPQDINKSIYYFKLSADQNDNEAQYYLGLIYYEENGIPQDMEKSIFYFNLSSKQNNNNALYYLGLIFSSRKSNRKDVLKGIDYLIQASEKRNPEAHFPVGYFYHEGKYIKQDIYEAIKYYKEASNCKNYFAKNNLGIIYKNGFLNIIQPNIQLSIEYFKEALSIKKSVTIMYNLAHLYFYNSENNVDFLDKSIELLISSLSIKYIYHSEFLLYVALLKKYESDIKKINEFIEEIKLKEKIIFKLPINFIKERYLFTYELYKSIDFLYTDDYDLIELKNLNKPKIKKNDNSKYNITKEFYEGFGV